MELIISLRSSDSPVNPLTRIIPKGLLPILNKPMLELLIPDVVQAHVERLTIVLKEQDKPLISFLRKRQRENVELQCRFDERPTQVLKNVCALNLSSDKTIVHWAINGFLLPNWVHLLEEHRQSAKIVSLVSFSFCPLAGYWQLFEDSRTHTLTHFQQVTNSGGKQSLQLFSGIWLFKPQIFSFIEQHNIQDFEQELVPKLLQEGVPVNLIHYDGVFEPFNTLFHYWDFNLKWLSQPEANRFLADFSEPVPGIKIGKNCKIKTNIAENFIPPVVIGHNCVIGKDVTIRGPCLIGNHVKIDRQAHVEKSIVFERTYIGKAVEVNQSVVVKNWYFSLKTEVGTFVEEEFILGPYPKSTLRSIVLSFFGRLWALGFLLLFFPLLLGIGLILATRFGLSALQVTELPDKQIKLNAIDDYQYIKNETVKYWVFRTKYKVMTGKNGRKGRLNQKGPFYSFLNFLERSKLNKLPLLVNMVKGELKWEELKKILLMD